jgi:ribosomal protein S18 acetylase RimI-like enzyme
MAEVHNATKTDLDAAVGLWRQLAAYHAALDPAFSPAEDAEETFRKFLKKSLRRRDALVLVAVEGGKVVGLCTAYIHLSPPLFRPDRIGNVADLVVDEAFRRRGIGTALVGEARRWLERNNVGRCRAMVATLNDSSRAFWQKAGFTEHVVVLEKTLPRTLPPGGRTE